MTDDAIFLVDAGGLMPLKETPYENEDILQKLLEDHPSLIAGMTTAGDAGRLLLVRREMSVPAGTGPTGLSLDHLFVDDAAIPVLVEVKRSSDTRSRREVVAQMLDYVANGVQHWPPEQLRDAVRTQATADGLDEAQVLLEELGVDDADEFWLSVQGNLRQGRVRCVFLADRLSPGLVRIIEFLNEQMRDTEVLGVELPRYKGAGSGVVYVPRVVGRTAEAAAAKQVGTGLRWDRAGLLGAAQAQCSDAAVGLLTALLEHREAAAGGRFSWGTGATAGVTGWYLVGGIDTPVWNVNLGASSGHASLYFILREYRKRHAARVTTYAAAVKQLPGMSSKVDVAEQNEWKSWVSTHLEDAAKSKDSVLAALDAATTSAAGPGE